MCQLHNRLLNTCIYLMLNHSKVNIFKTSNFIFIVLSFTIYIKECVKCNDIDIRNIFLSIVVSMI